MRRSSDGILLRLGYHLIARPFGLAMLLLLRAFLPSYAATAAYGVLGQAHSQVRVRDQEICLIASRRKLLFFKWDKQRSATIERRELGSVQAADWS